MSKVKSLIAFILASIVYIIYFGYFTESNSAGYLHSTLIRHRAIETPPFKGSSWYTEYGTNKLIRPGGVGKARDGGEGKASHEADQLQGENDGDYNQYSHASSSSQQDALRNSSTPLEVRIKEWKTVHSTNLSSSPLRLEPVPHYRLIKGQKYFPGQDPHSLKVQRKPNRMYDRGVMERSKGTGAKYGVLHHKGYKARSVQQHLSFNWRNLPEKLYQLAPFIFDAVPKQFIPEFKNPCWYTAYKQLRCLPYFYLLGFPKCGTTDLWDKINNHPNVARTRRKETQFWRGHKRGSLSPFYNYLSNAMPLTYRLLSGDSEAVYGDGSATTIITHWKFVNHFPNVTGMYTNVDIIKELTPKAKIIIAIREPVARLYSAYLYHRINEKRSPRGFHQRAMKDISVFNECLKRDEELKCIFGKSTKDRLSQRLKTGIYAPFIKAWVDSFGFDQAMVIRLEDWKANCSSILPKIFEFLELDVLDTKAISDLCGAKAKNVNIKRYTSIGDMLPSTRKLLEEFYVPYNEELAEYLNIPVYHAKY